MATRSTACLDQPGDLKEVFGSAATLRGRRTRAALPAHPRVQATSCARRQRAVYSSQAECDTVKDEKQPSAPQAKDSRWVTPPSWHQTWRGVGCPARQDHPSGSRSAGPPATCPDPSGSRPAGPLLDTRTFADPPRPFLARRARAGLPGKAGTGRQPRLFLYFGTMGTDTDEGANL
jgi:hypothetical protein